MSFDLTPTQYLTMLNETYEVYKAEPLSLRKAICCFGFSNALPEIIFARYGTSEPLKVHNKNKPEEYREYLRTECEDHHTVRDLCDFSKHAVLGRASVAVKKTEQKKREEYTGLTLLIGFCETERLVVTFQNGNEKIMDEILKNVVESWKNIFERDRL